MASPHIEQMVAEIRRIAGDAIAEEYRGLCEEIHACTTRQDFTGMRAVVLKSKGLLKKVEEAKRQQEQQQQ